MTEYHLSNAEFAELFTHDHRVNLRPGDKAADLLDDVERWLADGGMSHRSPMAVARAVEDLAKSAPLPTPEINAFEANQMEGIGDQVPDVSGLSMAEYSRARMQSGMPGSRGGLVEFLGGGR